MRRDTMAVAAELSPMANEYTNVSIDSVSPTVATASTPTFATKKASTTAKRDSMTISRIMGTDNKTMARSILPCVKSCSSPRKACRSSVQRDVHFDC